MAALSSGDSISQVKLGRVTQQSVILLRHLKKFFNLTFKIEECQDDVYDESSDEEDSKQDSDNAKSDNQMTEEQETDVQFPKAFIFSCIGIGLTNFARKAE